MRPISLVPLVAGLVWLTFKAEYLAMDAPHGLKALIVAPGAILLVVAAILAFPDARRRISASLLALGAVAVLWTVREPLPNGGWTFTTPYSSLDASIPGSERPPYLKGPDSTLAAIATLLPSVGLAILARRSWVGGLSIGAALWCALCFAPSRWIDARVGMPHRYAYYYSPSRRPIAWDRDDLALPSLLGIAGVTLLVRQKRRGREGDLFGTSPEDARP